MKNIYGNDGPVIFADDGKFEVIGQVGNEIFYKGGSIKVTGNIGSSIDGKVEGDEPGPVPPGPVVDIDPYTIRFAFSKSDTDPTSIQNGGTWKKIDNYPGYNNVWEWTKLPSEEGTLEISYSFGTDYGSWNLTEELDPEIKVIAFGDFTVNTGIAVFMGIEGLFQNSTGIVEVCDIELPYLRIQDEDDPETLDLSKLFEGCTNLIKAPKLILKPRKPGWACLIGKVNSMFKDCTKLIEIPMFDTSSTFNMSEMFMNCTSLITVPQMDCTKLKHTESMFEGCTNLKTIPHFEFNVQGEESYWNNTFSGCVSVESGLLDFYREAKKHYDQVPWSEYSNCFTDAGTNTESGRAERAQIPQSWGGDAEG